MIPLRLEYIFLKNVRGAPLNRHNTPSGHSRVYRVTQLRTEGVHCRESAGTGPVNLAMYDVLVLLLFHTKTCSVLVANPKKTTSIYTVANPARGLLNRETKTKKSLAAPPPPPPPTLLVRRKIKVMRRIYMSRCYAGRRYAGLGPSRVRTRTFDSSAIGQWVSLRKILRCFRVP